MSRGVRSCNVLLTYIDESYNDEYYFIGALLVPDAQANSLSEALDSVVAKASARNPKLPSAAELHGTEIYGGKKAWRGIEVPERIQVYSEALKSIADHEVSIILRGVHVTGLRARYSKPAHPHSVVLAHLLERVDEHAEAAEEQALVIADEGGPESKYRGDLALYRIEGTSGYRNRQIIHIVDTIHFAPSIASRLIQAADLITYLHFKRSIPGKAHDRAQAANDRLWNDLGRTVKHLHTWYPTA